MTPIEKATIKSYHQHRFKQDHYSQAQKQVWVDTQVQQLRFQTIATLADFDDTSVLDVGCGYGTWRVVEPLFIINPGSIKKGISITNRVLFQNLRITFLLTRVQLKEFN